MLSLPPALCLCSAPWCSCSVPASRHPPLSSLPGGTPWETEHSFRALTCSNVPPQAVSARDCPRSLPHRWPLHRSPGLRSPFFFITTCRHSTGMVTASQSSGASGREETREGPYDLWALSRGLARSQVLWIPAGHLASSSLPAPPPHCLPQRALAPPLSPRLPDWVLFLHTLP